MKKSLIALAALAFVGAAAAQSSVTLYGVADIWVGKFKQEQDSTTKVISKGQTRAGSGGVATSRWGVKGAEDLGGGLKANFNFEQGVDLGNGAAAGFTRQANVGFSGGFGTVKLGKSWTALDDVFGAANSGFDSALSANKVWLNSYTDSADAQIYYATPVYAGFSGAISTQLNGNVAAPASTNKTTAFNVKYAAGPIAAAVGYEDSPTQKGTMFNGSYDLGVAKLLGSYYTTKADTTNSKTNSYQFGADIPLSSALTLSVGYANSKVKGTAKADSAFSIAAGYSLSKRTLVYTGYKAESIKSVGNPDKDLFAIGVNHTF